MKDALKCYNCWHSGVPEQPPECWRTTCLKKGALFLLEEAASASNPSAAEVRRLLDLRDEIEREEAKK